MPKANIREIVTKPVIVEEPQMVEIHRALGGKTFIEGSPAGREAQPNPKAIGHKDVRIGS